MWKSAEERYLATSLESRSQATPVLLSVMASYDQATKFLGELNRYAPFGLAAIVSEADSSSLSLIHSRGPWEIWWAGVRALDGGDLHHPWIRVEVMKSPN